ncbi:hypothetical protein N9004_02000 [Pirellulales bacterium]|nr:hypothetical protein [Pirellulales bacterium]MDB4475507.1 hypothetical protein [Pirellulales bacterium]
MEFDRLDQSFIDQQVLITRQGVSEAAGLESEEVTAVSITEQSGEKSPRTTEVVSKNRAASEGEAGCSDKNSSDTLAGLLAALPAQWKAITDRVVEAQESGHRIIAIAGHRVQEGRTTIAQGLFTILSASGWQVRCLNSMQELWCELIDDSQSVAWHRDRAGTSVSGSRQSIVLVDAGIWFTRGPFRRREMALRVFGCDAVLLVRHADVPPCPHRQQLLGELGVFPIGEVVTFSGEMECGSCSQDSANSCRVA